MCPLWLLALLSLLGACDDPDSAPWCGSSTMANPRIEGGLVDVTDGQELTLVWDVGEGILAELPPEYFEALQTEQERETAVEATAEVTGEREITLRFVGLEDHLVSTVYFSFSLTFPDRSEQIDCTYDGHGATYLVDIMLTFNDDRTFQSASFDQWADIAFYE